MGVKRPSSKTSPADAARIVDLRRRGLSYREIQREVGLSQVAIANALRAAGMVGAAAGAPASTTAADARAERRLRRAGEAAAEALEALAKAVKRRADDGELDPKAIAGLAAALGQAFRYARLFGGRPTSHTKTERNDSAEQLTPEERRLLDLAGSQ